MKAEIFDTPVVLNMGFHYTRQYSRRSRVTVMGLVAQGSEEWERWYMRMHEPAALREIAEAGYTAIEIHFIYGFGLESEREEWELTREMTRRAHAAGLKVFGYLQFLSVQEELFFPENPWARDCIQVDARGERIQYAYDRPALCFTHEKVREYYLDALELGLKTCDLDGIRLDNDYFRGCYCERCQAAFREWLAESFDAAEARRVFGYSETAGMSLVPVTIPRDPLWCATVLFRQQYRQGFMRQLRERVESVKPGAILGGNPGVNRRYNDPYNVHVFMPDLGETHHLVCAENHRFPARAGDSIRHQVVSYKYGQAYEFAVFASHHLKKPDGSGLRWPETSRECALSMCEGLAFGGHPVCTSWGIRMDGSEDRTLYRRPEFMRALRPIADFVRENGEIYDGAECDASTGIFQNRASLTFDARNAWLSLQGAVQTFLQHQIPFRFVDCAGGALPGGLSLVVVPDMSRMADFELDALLKFAEAGGKVLLTGGSGHSDEWAIPREATALRAFLDHPRVVRLPGSPEKISFSSQQELATQLGEEDTRKWHCDLPLPAEHELFAAKVKNMLPAGGVEVESTRFVTIDSFIKPTGERLAHLLNYDEEPGDVVVNLPAGARDISFRMPAGLGARSTCAVPCERGGVSVRLEGLSLYAVLSYRL